MHSGNKEVKVSDSQKSSEQPVSYKETIRFLSINIGCFPETFGQFNKDILRPNQERVKEIANYILAANQVKQSTSAKESKLEYPLSGAPHIVFFQESFDQAASKTLQEALKSDYPYFINNAKKELLPNVLGGLSLYSKFPILDAKFYAYTNAMLGEETIGKKGFLAVKLQVDGSHFITVYTTHLHAGGAFFKGLSSKLGGTTSQRRGEQMADLALHMQKWATTPPKQAPKLKHLKTVLAGDLNQGLNDERRMLAISSGMSKNGFKKGDIKYPGQHYLFSKLLERTVPQNFMEIRDVNKKIDETLKAKAKEQNKYVGTLIEESALKENIKSKTKITANDVKPKIVDAMHCSLNGNKVGRFSSKIWFVGNASDHAGLEGEYNYNVPEQSSKKNSK